MTGEKRSRPPFLLGGAFQKGPMVGLENSICAIFVIKSVGCQESNCHGAKMIACRAPVSLTMPRFNHLC